VDGRGGEALLGEDEYGVSISFDAEHMDAGGPGTDAEALQGGFGWGEGQDQTGMDKKGAWFFLCAVLLTVLRRQQIVQCSKTQDALQYALSAGY
jgi:hypothetical protein